MTIESGRSPSGRDTHERSRVAPSPPTAGIPNALADGLGLIVSMIADARDTYPDDTVTLEAVTEAVHELYGCLIDGVFGPVQFKLADEAFEEALRRYPDSHDALVFLWGASGLGFRPPTAEQLAWAQEKAQAIEARRAETLQDGSVHESAVATAMRPDTATTPTDAPKEQ